MRDDVGSGLEPDVSPGFAALQVGAGRCVRGEWRRSAYQRPSLVTPPAAVFGIFGEPRVNVLELNLDLNNAYPAAEPRH